MQVHYQGYRSPRWFVWLLAIPLLILAAIFGLFVLATVLGLAVVAAVVLGMRLWIVRRRIRHAQARHVLDGEYIRVRDCRHD